MRPLAVIALVVLAAGALFAALFLTGRSSDDGDREVVRRAEPVAPVAPTRQPDVQDVVPDPEPREIDTRAVVAPTERQAAAGADNVQRFYSNELTGLVLGPDQMPVEGAVVSLARVRGNRDMRMITMLLQGANSSEPTWTARADAEGAFSFVNLPPGTDYELSARHDAFALTTVSGVDVTAEGQSRRDIVMTLGHIVQGYVYDAAGAPLPGAELELMNAILANLPLLQSNNGKGRVDLEQHGVLRVESNEHGFYKFPNVAVGNHSITCKANGYGTRTERKVEIKAEENQPINLDFRLDPALQITGRVFSPGSPGIAGARVQALTYGSGQATQSSAVTDAAGNFEITGLVGGTYMIVAQADGYTSEKEQRIEAGTNNLEIELAVLGGVQGRVIDAISGEAVTKFSVALRQFNAGHLGRAQNKANGADGDVPGAFVVTGLATGDYAVEITANGYAPSMSETFRIDQGTVTPDVVVRMSAGGALAGRIVDATGRPVADAIVTTNDNGYVKNPLSDILGGLQARTTTGRSTRTDADGRFELDMLRPETYQLEVEHPDYTKQITRDLRVVDGSVVEVPTISMTSGGILRGMVYGVDGLPAAGAKVSLQGTGQVGIVQPMQAIAGPDGRYTIRRIAGGTYKVSATRPNAETSGNPFDMILDMRKSEQTIDIVEGGEHGVDLRLGGG